MQFLLGTSVCGDQGRYPGSRQRIAHAVNDRLGIEPDSGQARIERALEDDYLSRDPSTSKRAAYIRRTMEKARRWAER